jgi:protein TonB
MLVKKHMRARLSPFSKNFFQLGLALALLVIYIGLEWKSVDRMVSDFNTVNLQSIEEEIIPMTERIVEVKPPPPPPPAPEKIEIIADEVEIEESVLESTETDESQANETIQIDEIEENIEEEEVPEKDIPFAIIEEAPVFPGCTGTKAQKRQCLQDKIKNHVNKKFRTNIAQDIGLSAGKKKVYVQFTIDKNGNIINVRARGPHARLEKEAIRVVKLLPKMKPGLQRTRPVRVSYTLPITLVVLNQ